MGARPARPLDADKLSALCFHLFMKIDKVNREYYSRWLDGNGRYPPNRQQITGNKKAEVPS